MAIVANIPQFCGYSLFSMESIGSILPIRNGMKDKNKFRKVFISTVSGLAVFIIIFGVTGYLRFGDVTKPIIFFSYPSEYVFLYLCQIFYALGCMLSFQIYVVVACMSIYRLQSLKGIFNGENGYYWGTLLRFFTVLILFGISMSGIRVIDLMELSG